MERKNLICSAILMCFSIAAISLSSKSHLYSLPSSNNIKKENSVVVCKTWSNYCEMEGDIRIEVNSSTILVVSADYQIVSNFTKSWRIQPYPRSGTSHIRNWTVILVQQEQNNNIPKCSKSHNSPAILFSLKGYLGNLYHDFADMLFPLYQASSHLKGEVHFLATNYQQGWVDKFNHILSKLTKYEIMDIDGQTSHVHCFKKMHLGLMTMGFPYRHDPNPNPNSPSMHNFRRLLRQTYSLERENTTSISITRRWPRLMIIPREDTRVLLNEDGVSRMARKLGFEVVVAKVGTLKNLTRFAKIVNSCDVLMGVHGAGLTNMLFLPENAILIQIVPFGGGNVNALATVCYGNTAPGMDMRYLEYNITIQESSITQKYSMDHPVLKHPKKYNYNWHYAWLYYLQQQNVTVDLSRLNATFAKALYLLRH